MKKTYDTRDLYIDFIRGIAALSIIVIHTAFHSGGSYVKPWFQSLTLLIDVPLFFFIAGVPQSFRFGNVLKTLKGLWNLWLKYVFFVFILAVLHYILNSSVNISELFTNFAQSCLFDMKFTDFRTVRASTWFLPVFFTVIPSNQVIFFIIDKLKLNKNRCIISYILLLFIAIILCSVFGKNLLMNIFYGFFFNLGILYGMNKEFKIDLKTLLVSVILITSGCLFFSYFLHTPIHPLQNNKFPPNIIYLTVSLISILFAVYMKPFVKNPNKFMVHVGQNALWYYFAQGIGASLIYKFLFIQTSDWFIKFLILLTLNYMFTIIIAELFIFTYNFIFRHNIFKHSSPKTDNSAG